MKRTHRPGPSPSFAVLVATLVGATACDAPASSDEPLGVVHQAFDDAESEGNNTSAFSDPVKAVDMVSAQLPVGDADTFVLAARPGDRLFALLDTSGNLALDTELNLYTDQNLSNPIETDDNDGPNASSVLAGTVVPVNNESFVYLRVVNGGPTSGGSYRLQSYLVHSDDFGVESEGNDAVGVANAMTESSVRGQLALGDVDYFAFEASAGSRVAVIVDNDPTEDGVVGSLLSVVDGADTTLASGKNGNNANGNGAFFTVGVTGTHYVRLAAPLSNPNGEYELAVLVDGRPPAAVAAPSYVESGNNVAMNSADSLKGHHPGEGAVVAGSSDHWRLLSDPGDRIYAYVDAQQAQPSADVTLTVTDVMGSPLEVDEHDGPDDSAVVAGAYSTSESTFLVVSEPSDSAVGDYHVFAAAFDPTDVEVQVILNNNQSIATARPLGNARIQALTTMNDLDYYAFAARAGETVVVIVDEDSDDNGVMLDTSLSLRNGADEVLAQGDDSHGADEDAANAVGPLLIPQDGTYFVRVANDDQTASSGGIYEMVLLRSSGPIACGDGDLDGSEGCDDANAGAGDGCGVDCAVEPGFTCSGEPSICSQEPGQGGAGGTGGTGAGPGSGGGANGGGSTSAAGGDNAGGSSSGGGSDDGGGCAYASGSRHDGSWLALGLALLGLGRRRRRVGP
jgi:cysteine-rich repeat protein